MKTINTRRSIRKYAEKEIGEELLNRLLREAARTQTMGNLQLYSVVVTRSDEMKAKLAPAHFNQVAEAEFTCYGGRAVGEKIGADKNCHQSYYEPYYA